MYVLQVKRQQIQATRASYLQQSYGKQDQMFMDQFYISEPDYSLSKTSKLSYISVYDLTMPYQVFQADMVSSNTVIFQNKTILLELSDYRISSGFNTRVCLEFRDHAQEREQKNH